MQRLTAILALALALMLALPAQAAQRLALVIGNDSYAHVAPLEKARGDAEAVTAALGSVGFEVDTVLDATRREMNRAIARFTARLQPGDTALVFYAGHGVEIGGENYLLPLDIEVPDATGADYIQLESVALSELMQRVQDTGARTTLMFIDACRDNPFAATTGRSIGGTRGLARIAAPEGSFVVFSAGARQQALDRLDEADKSRNSVFTRLLLPKLTQPDLELRDLIADLRVEVRELALTREHAQFPAYYDELLGEFYFAPTRGLAPVPAPAAQAAGESDTRADFELAQSVGTEAAYRAFLEKHAESGDLSVTLARTALAALAPEGDAPVATAAQGAAAGDGRAVRHLDDRRDRIAATQAALNARGCAAGVADGVAGARTRAALVAFIRHSGKAVELEALGSQYVLDVIETTAGRVCPEATAATPSAGGAAINAAASLAGTWRFSASCPLFIKTTGMLRVRRIGEGAYGVSKGDSLGGTATGNLYETTGKLTGNYTWSTGVQETTSGRLAADRRSFTGSNSLGCTFTARRAD